MGMLNIIVPPKLNDANVQLLEACRRWTKTMIGNA